MSADNAAERATPVLYSRAAVVDGSVSEEDRSVEFICSTEDIDGHGTIVKQNWRLKRFNENPVVLYAHNQWDLPIGLASDVRVEDGKLRAKVTFSKAELNQQAEQVWLNVKARTLRGISAGFMSHSVKWEKHEDREVLVLDENELFELSITPCPSNAGSLAQLRSMRASTQEREASQPTQPALDAGENRTPIEEERETMSDNKDTGINIAVARALSLPIGSTENDAINRVTALREIEAVALEVTSAKSSHEVAGALRAMGENNKRLKSVEDELATVKAERDSQNFENLVQQALNERKMTPAEAQFKRDGFAAAVREGRGSAFVDELRGWVRVAAPRMGEARKQPEVRAAGAELTWNGKKYSELKHAQRARLANEDPELWRLMKADHEAQTA